MSGGLRLFVGIAVDERVRQRVAEVQEQLTKSLAPIRWVAKENLHLTLKFLGPVQETRVAPITDTLAKALSNQECVCLSVNGLGVFPSMRRARILWAGLLGQGLERLAQCVEEQLEPLGFERENRPFQPHLTLGRWRVPAKDQAAIRAALGQHEHHDFGDFSVDHVNLFQSTLYTTGAVYSVLDSFLLAGGRQF